MYFLISAIIIVISTAYLGSFWLGVILAGITDYVLAKMDGSWQ